MGTKRKSDSVPEVQEVVVFLKPPKGGRIPAPSQTRSAAEAVLRQAESQTGVRAESTNVMANTHSFSVRAPKSFIDALSRASEVARVLGNEAPSAFITPVDQRPVDLPD